jgi:Leucine-rich repeat (LRR) protein
MLIPFVVLTTAGVSLADEAADLKAFAEATGAKSIATGTGLPVPRLEFDDKTTDAHLTKLAAIKPKSLKSLDLQYCTQITPMGIASLGVLPSITHLCLPSKLDEKAYLAISKQMPNLEEFLVKGFNRNTSGLTDAGLAHLTKCDKLKTVTLVSVPLTDQSWATFAKLPALTEITIADSAITGVGLKQLVACKKLTRLNFMVCDLSEQGFGELAELQSLTHLMLEETGIKDRDLVALSLLKNLTFLSLESEKLTDNSLKSIAAMPSLRTLAVMKVPFTDRGLEHLAGAKSLREVRLNFTRVTPAGIEQLKKGLPNTDIQKNK